MSLCAHTSVKEKYIFLKKLVLALINVTWAYSVAVLIASISNFCA